jgi:hypothetical protein
LVGRAVRALSVVLFLASSVEAGPSWLDLSFRGYLKDMVSLSRQDYALSGQGESWKLGNVIHTRQNLRWFPLTSTTCALELKTRNFLGENIRSIVEYNENLTRQATYFDWTWMILDEDDFSMTTAVDRAWIDCYLGSTQATLGRQRIAWGTNLVWNPIDLFNPVSPLDFDTEEKPGADGVRVQYYASSTSKLEVAAAPSRDSSKKVIAGLFRVNRWEYDFYVVGGRRHENWVGGGAWAGQISGAGFRGEWLYAHPDSGSEYPDPFGVTAVSGDYTFPNSFYLHAEFLYNSTGSTGDAGGWRLAEAIQRGELSPARISLFGEAAYNLSPLVRADLACMVNPQDHSWFLGPAASWSVATDFDLAVTGFLFGGGEGTEFGDSGEVLMAQMRFSF